MQVAGIIAEYNPLHNGHVHHLEKTREVTGCDYVMVVMSGDYVQRGEPAVANKFTRTKWALESGADIVFELPAVCALSSAERFALGGVSVLAGTGVLNYLCFGSEEPDILLLTKAAQILADETPAFKRAMQEQLTLGKSYPRARFDAFDALGAPHFLLDALRSPNSILGIEYIRFLQKLAPKAQPVAIHRLNSDYNSPLLTGTISSATAIREALFNSNPQAYKCMPQTISTEFASGSIKPVHPSSIETLALYALRKMSMEQLQALPDVREGFENVLQYNARHSNSIEGLLAALKSKRYTLARCKRIVMCALLGITKTHLINATQAKSLYLRVLGFRRSARPLISAISRNCSLPLIIRKADIAKCALDTSNLLELDIRAHDIYALLEDQSSIPRDFTQPPVIV